MKELGIRSEQEYSALLVDRILSGSQSAETDMVKRYQQKLFRIVYARSKDSDLTHDIVQETWAITLEKVRNAQLHNKGSLSGFICNIGINQLKMHYRTKRKVNIVEETDLHELRDGVGISSEYTDYDSLFATIWKPLLQMSADRDRDILFQFYIKGAAKDELCNRYNLTAEHFDRVLYRARERFKKAWEASNDEL